jgi:hypothetical protein
MEIGRLYSRICGWENGPPVKSYNSDIITVFPKDVFDIDGKTGAFIVKYMDKHGLCNTYEEAYTLCKTYPSWFFYYGEMKTITSITL